MTERATIASKAYSFFNDLWTHGDPWGLETSDFERARYARLIAMLDQPRYPRVLEIGCGAGAFTRLLAPLADRLLALDVSSEAIARAQRIQVGPDHVEFRVANVMDYRVKEEGPWDLIVLSETIYFLGWLYSFFDVSWLAGELCAATRVGGQVLLANTQMGMSHPLLLPWIIRTYRDLFLNVGYELRNEEIFRSQKNGVTLEVLISLFCKADAVAPQSGSKSA
jgi:SAM-dependent methyltransferase